MPKLALYQCVDFYPVIREYQSTQDVSLEATWAKRKKISNGHFTPAPNSLPLLTVFSLQMSCMLSLWTPRPAFVIKIIQDCGQILFLVTSFQTCWNLLGWTFVSEIKIKFDLACLTKLCFGISVFFCGPLHNLISPWLLTLMWFFLGDDIVEPKHWIICFSSEISAAKFWERFVWWHVQWNKNHILLMERFFYLVAPGDVCRDWQCLNTYLLLQVLPWKVLILCQLWLSMAFLSYMRLCGRFSIFPPCLL